MKYVVRTKQLVEREYVYEFELELPVEPRVADKIVVGAAKSGKLQLGIDIAPSGAEEGLEKIVCVEREGTQVYPRVRKGKEAVSLPLTTVEDE